MAKQSGIHQLRGKVGEHSYYRQTGITSGLVRSINQGLSSRVKTSDEYVNTRLNNSEFAGAANVAGLLGKMVSPKFRPMILPFSQSRMAKSLLELAKKSSFPWGARVVSAADTPDIAAILSAQSKRDYSEFVSVDVTRDSETAASASVSYTTDQATLMSSLGINALTVSAVLYDVASGRFNNVTGKIQSGYLRMRYKVLVFDNSSVAADSGLSEEESLIVPSFAPTPELYYGHRFVVFVIMPKRIVGDVSFVLQEYCSFVCVQLPDA